MATLLALKSAATAFVQQRRECPQSHSSLLQQFCNSAPDKHNTPQHKPNKPQPTTQHRQNGGRQAAAQMTSSFWFDQEVTANH